MDKLDVKYFLVADLQSRARLQTLVAGPQPHTEGMSLVERKCFTSTKFSSFRIWRNTMARCASRRCMAQTGVVLKGRADVVGPKAQPEMKPISQFP